MIVTSPIIFIVIIFLLSACGSGASEHRTMSDAVDTVSQAREGRRTPDGNILADTFDVNYTLRGDTLIVSLDTDLPDRTALMVSVDRTFHTHEGSETYVVEYFTEATTVGAWRNPHTIILDDNAWKRTLDERRRILGISGEPFTVKSISPEFEIGFVVPMVQDPPFTRWNANLRGRVVSVDEDGRRLIEREIRVARPIDTSDLSRTQWADPLNLIPGRSYRISRQTPLVPELEPADPLTAISRIQRLDSGTAVRVTRVAENDGPWYRVRVVSGSASGAEGWINSTALLGQEIVAVP
jgi:hypothetical protein